MRGFRVAFAVASVCVGISAYACGSSDDSTFGNGSDGGGGGGLDASLGNDTGGGLGGGVCDPPCGAGQFCSAANKCIDNGTCAADKDCPAGEICDDGDGGSNTCVPGGGCGSTKVAADVVPPNLLITLDRSCSMTDKITLGDGGKATKWVIIVAALDKMMVTYEGKIRFGLLMFPTIDGQKCAEDGGFAFPVGPGQEAAISAVLNAALDAGDPNFPDGPCVTNIDTAMIRASTDPGLADKTRGDFVILATDGKQAGCSLGGGAAGALAATHKLYVEGGVPTFSIGFGGSADPAFLSNIAIEGGTPLADASFPDLFYNAADDIQLQQALDSIATKTLGCELALGTVPPDSTKLYVFVDGGDSVTRDPGHTNGWDYSSATNTVTFYGAICDSLKSGTVSDVQVVYGCNATPK